MKLIETNKYLRNKKYREKAIAKFAYYAGKSAGLDITLKDTYKIVLNLGR